MSSVNHHARHVVEELVKWCDSVAAEVIELVNEDLRRLVRDRGGGDGQCLIREEVAIVRRRQLGPEVWYARQMCSDRHLVSGRTFNRLALRQIVVLRLGEQTGFVAPDDTLNESGVYLCILT